VYALEDGGERAPYVKVSEVAGVSRQAVRELVKRHGTDNETREEDRMRARLDFLDATYERAIDRMTDRAGDYKHITAYQNAQAGKRRRKGLAPLTPVSVRLRDYAESCFLRALEENRDNHRWERVIADLDESAALRKTLEAIDDARLGF
jgi:hypothetical protein